MTIRQKAAFHRYALLERRASPRHIPDGADVEKTLAKLPAYAPIMLTSHDIRCYGCDQLIELGATAFACQGHPHAAPVLCFNCGVGWCIHAQAASVESFDDLPATGGPVS